MKRLWRLVGMCLLLVLLTACPYFYSMFGLEKADLIVKSIEPEKDSAGVLSSVRFVLANIGGTDAYGFQYILRADAEQPVGSSESVELYRDVVSLRAGGEEKIELDRVADIQVWMNAAGIDRTAIDASASYHLGVEIDPENSIEETVEGNNETHTSLALPIQPAG